MKKKIIILSSKIGHGHMSPAIATQQALEQLFPNKYDIEIIDFFDLASKSINKITKRALYASVKYAPGIYKTLYKKFDKKTQMKMLNMLQYPLVANKIRKFFQEKNPDLILSVYPIWDHSTVLINKKNGNSVPFISLITDSIEVHHAWVSAGADYHIVVNQDTAKAVQKMGVPKKSIKVLGLPVRLQFTEKINKVRVFKKYKLNPKKELILFISTAENSKKLVKQVKEIARNHIDKNIMVITGNDKDGLKALNQLEWTENTQVFGFKKNIHELIKSADLVIGKAGGSVVQECLACKTPMVLTQVIPGHEEGNALLIRKYNLGIDLTQKNITLNEAITKIIKNKKKYQERLKNHSKPKAALKVAEFIDSLL